MRARGTGGNATIPGQIGVPSLIVVVLLLITGCAESGEATTKAPAPESHGLQAILERAKQRGVLFWGGGNEPGWNIQIDPEQTILVTAYGEERYEFATPPADIEEEGRRTIYRTRIDGHEILVDLTQETCNDTMSDYTFPARVRVKVDGRELRGCGTLLNGSGR